MLPSAYHLQASAGEIALPDTDPSRASTTTNAPAKSSTSGTLSKVLFFGAGGAGLYLLLRSHPLAGIGLLAVALFGGGLAETSDR